MSHPTIGPRRQPEVEATPREQPQSTAALTQAFSALRREAGVDAKVSAWLQDKQPQLAELVRGG